MNTCTRRQLCTCVSEVVKEGSSSLIVHEAQLSMHASSPQQARRDQ